MRRTDTTPRTTPANVDLFPAQKAAVELLSRRTGLDEKAVLYHLAASGLFWSGLDPSGEASFELLLAAAAGKDRAADLRSELFGANVWEMDAAGAVAEREAEERRATRPGLFPVEAEA